MIPMQQIKALLQNVGTSFCPDYVDWFGIEAADIHPRNADRSVVSKFLQANPCDNSTTKLKVGPVIFLRLLNFGTNRMQRMFNLVA